MLLESSSIDPDPLANVDEEYGLHFLVELQDIQKEDIAWKINIAPKSLLSNVKLRVFNSPVLEYGV